MNVFCLLENSDLPLRREEKTRKPHIEGSLPKGAIVKELLKEIVQALVDRPDQVQVNEIKGSSMVVLELRVAKEDVGKVIGKQGRTAQSIRLLLSAIGTKLKKRAVLEILDD